MKKNVLITGAGGNLGSAAVDRFLKDEWRVIAALSRGKKLTAKGDILTIEADLTLESEVEAQLDKVVGDVGTIDAALLLAGGYASGDIYETTVARLQEQYSLNFLTAYNVARPVFAQMMKQASGGRIVFVGSRPALQAKDGKSSLAYALAKSLVFKLADFLNAEGSAHNVTCAVIVPSTIDTPQNRKSMPKADFSSWVRPEAIADVLAFAVSQKGDPLRDTILKVYGGA
jgi:NAD(P)-dependent dehydrogenase (short-subunit alcohol dehydrogenase family)